MILSKDMSADNGLCFASGTAARRAKATSLILLLSFVFSWFSFLRASSTVVLLLWTRFPLLVLPFWIWILSLNCFFILASRPCVFDVTDGSCSSERSQKIAIYWSFKSFIRKTSFRSIISSCIRWHIDWNASSCIDLNRYQFEIFLICITLLFLTWSALVWYLVLQIAWYAIFLATKSVSPILERILLSRSREAYSFILFSKFGASSFTKDSFLLLCFRSFTKYTKFWLYTCWCHWQDVRLRSCGIICRSLGRIFFRVFFTKCDETSVASHVIAF